MNYTITQKDKLWEAIKFVMLARREGEAYFAFNCIKVEKGKVIATDGHRLHIAQAKHDMETGLYSVEKMGKSGVVLIPSETQATFPKFKDIVIKATGTSSFTITYHTAVRIGDLYAYGLAQRNILVNPKFLANLPEGKCYFTDGYAGIPIKIIDHAGELTAVIMPAEKPDITFTD